MKNEKDKNLLFIKKFSKIKIENICKRLGIYSGNLWRGTCSADKVKLVRDEIEKELDDIKEEKDDEINSL